MRKLLAAMFVALLMVGCGEEAEKKAVQHEAKDDSSVPLLIPCEACRKDLSKMSKTCPNCGHPTPASTASYKKERRLARIRAEKEQKRARIWAEEKRKVDPFGNLNDLARIMEAKKSGSKELHLSECRPDLSLLKGLTGLERLSLDNNGHTDLTPLAGLTGLKALSLDNNQIIDLTPLTDLLGLRYLSLESNPIPEEQKAMLKKALPNCDIIFDSP